MRFEAKNHFIKMLVGLNFKNVPKSVALRHQYYMCLQLLSSSGSSTNFLYKGDEIGKGTKYTMVEETCFMFISSGRNFS